jgi:hypothetical protein
LKDGQPRAEAQRYWVLAKGCFLEVQLQSLRAGQLSFMATRSVPKAVIGDSGLAGGMH